MSLTKEAQASQNQNLWKMFLGSRGNSISANSSISFFPVVMSISSTGIAKRVRNQILCPKYSTRKMGSVIYAARKSDTLNLSGQNT